MKTTKKYNVVFILLLLFNLSVFAQYNGGNADGNASSSVINTTCSQPPQFFAYFGGTSDGASTNSFINTTCGTPPQFFAYMGGNADGSSVNELSNVSCPLPPQFFAYMGGTDDGASMDELSNVSCPLPPQFYAYFGGDADGYGAGESAPVCPTDPPVAEFSASSVSICVGDSVDFTDESTNLPFVWNWTFTGGTPSSSTDQNPTVTYNTAGVYEVSLTAANFNGNDTETKTGYITVNAIPTVDTTTPASRCDAGTVTLGATASSGATLNWYGVATGGTLLGTGTSFTTPSISSTTSYYVEATANGCTSARTEVVATVNTTPSVTSTTPASRCDAGSVTLSATASAGTLSWYDAATGGTLLGTGINYTTPSISSTTSYYVEATSNGCTSPRIEVVATINTTPSITSTTPAGRCDTGTVTLGATADAGTIEWYSLPSGGTLLGTGTSFITPSISVSTTYYVQTSTATCTSPRTSVVATITATPTITGTTPGSVCDSGSVTLGATASSGATLNWYSVATGGTSLGSGTSFTTPSISSTTSYYVEAVNGSCVSSTRTEVIATVNVTPSITSTTDGSRCGTGTVVLTATASSGTLSWYANSTGGTSLGSGSSFTTPSISSTTTYYVEVTENGCTSSRTAVMATIDTMPTITSTTGGSVCDSGSVTLSATASSGVLSWYANSTGGTALGSGTSYATPNISSTTTYYVEVTNGTCTSPRTAVTATVVATPTITGTTPGSVCDSGSVTLGATASSGATLNWYSVATGGTSLGSGTSFTTPSISSTTSYYVEAVNGSCVSSTRTEVIATVNVTPSITSTTDGFRCGTGTVVLTATASSGTLSWYANSTGGTVLGSGSSFTTPSISSTTTYYVEVTENGCTSSRTAVMATIDTMPTITSTTGGSVCDSGSVTLSATASSGVLSWYANSTGGTALGSGTSYATPNISSTTTYYVEVTNGTCTSPRTAVTATVVATPTITGTTPGSVCDSGSVTLGATASSGATLNWYSVATGGTSLGSGTSFTTPSISSTTSYYVEAVNGSCVSSTRTEVIATVNVTPSITSTTDGSRCGTGTVVLTATASSGTLSWYANSTGGTVLGSGSSFTTPSISSTTTYYVEVTENGCTSSRIAVTATVISTSAPTGDANQTFCAGEMVGDIIVSGTNIIWYDAATGGNVISNTTLIVDGGIYYASQTDNGCESSTRLEVTMAEGGCLDTDDFVRDLLKIYPNPAATILNIEYSSIITNVQIFDVTGKMVYNQKENATILKIDVSQFARGTYILRIMADNKEKITKIIKQ